jgi:hypothetical protein
VLATSARSPTSLQPSSFASDTLPFSSTFVFSDPAEVDVVSRPSFVVGSFDPFVSRTGLWFCASNVSKAERQHGICILPSLSAFLHPGSWFPCQYPQVSPYRVSCFEEAFSQPSQNGLGLLDPGIKVDRSRNPRSEVTTLLYLYLYYVPIIPYTV